MKTTWRLEEFIESQYIRHNKFCHCHLRVGHWKRDICEISEDLRLPDEICGEKRGPWGSKRKAGAYPGRTHAFPLSPSLLTNIFNNLYKYILQVVQIHFAIWTDLCIHFAIWTNTVSNLGQKKKSRSLSEADSRSPVVTIAHI